MASRLPVLVSVGLACDGVCTVGGSKGATAFRVGCPNNSHDALALAVENSLAIPVLLATRIPGRANSQQVLHAAPLQRWDWPFFGQFKLNP